MNKKKQFIEHHQISIYLISLILATIVGLTIPKSAHFLENIISVLLVFLMFIMFSQLPFFQKNSPIISMKFILGLILSNFIFIPIFVYILVHIFQISHPGILIGVYLVLLAPCIDYVIVFTAMGKGNAQYMAMVTPILLLLQIVLLPVYLTLFLQHMNIPTIELLPFIQTFIIYIIIPFTLAIFLQSMSQNSKIAKTTLKATTWLPELFMALVLFSVVGSQIHNVISNVSLVYMVIPLYIIYLIIAPIIGYFSGKLLSLETTSIRTLSFSTSTRNALVVLPITFALPDKIAAISAIVIVTQTLIELLGELIYIKLIPKFIR
ncbi:arsenic resistance protein [Staphylococcus sp. ACRSN]|uniref:arsenic resistance protein n=1 Tax=Staphylococcus sp. ACRSN TaxID=2918214 RepID=UPI001EF25B04|nr:arsenic resistance protein [Staphylococcus sp. ACRSN]MCG7339488.1 arsenic resistance protein [Staphylococcus sp. ACRSN]